MKEKNLSRRKYLCCLLLLFLFSSVVFSQTLSFRVTDPKVVNVSGVDSLEFTIEVKSSSVLYVDNLQANFYYNGSALNASPPNITIFKKGISAGSSVSEGPEYYSAINGNSGRWNFLLNSNHPWVLGDNLSDFYQQVLTTWTPLVMVRVKMIDNTGEAGVYFDPTQMGNVINQNYVDPTAGQLQEWTGIVLDETQNLRYLYLGRIYSSTYGWTQSGGALDWSVPVNTSVWDTVTSAAVIPISGANALGLRIHPVAKLKINPGKDLTCTGPTEINEPLGLWLASDATGTGSFKDNGTVTYTNSGSAKVERYIAGVGANWLTDNSGWHLLSSPVAGQAVTAFTFAPVAEYDFYSYDETKTLEYWLNQKVPANTINNFDPGKGYLVAYKETGVSPKAFIGSLNTAPVSFDNLTRTTGSPNIGWHLVGNPFASAIKWNNGSYALSNIAGIAKVMNNNGSYTDKGANAIIPEMQGFYVQALNTNPSSNSFTIPLNARFHDNTTSWYKSGSNDRFLLVASDLESTMKQESVIAINEMASEGYDYQYDSHFLAWYAPQFYSKAGDEMLSTNTLPSVADKSVIQFGFVKNAGSNFSIELKERIDGYPVYLTDKKTNTVTNLTDTPVYSFTAAEGDDPNRFELHFLNTTSVKDPGKVKEFNVYSLNGIIAVQSLQQLNGKISVTDMAGRKVAADQVSGGATTQINMRAHPGIYNVSVFTSKGITNTKIFVK